MSVLIKYPPYAFGYTEDILCTKRTSIAVSLQVYMRMPSIMLQIQSSSHSASSPRSLTVSGWSPTKQHRIQMAISIANREYSHSSKSMIVTFCYQSYNLTSDNLRVLIHIFQDRFPILSSQTEYLCKSCCLFICHWQ